ncbi:hypothetical protein A7982_13361 [Minicystis rosea]|nr:hypothetical protein A7982_13361 [Minicystis rosea]
MGSIGARKQRARLTHTGRCRHVRACRGRIGERRRRGYNRRCGGRGRRRSGPTGAGEGEDPKNT